jgi:uncharacterized protein
MKTIRLALHVILTVSALATFILPCFANALNADEVRKKAEQGNADAQFVLSECYRLGLGVSQSNEEAVKWLRQASEQGNAEAQYRYGYLLDSGDLGVKQDHSEALKWFQKSAEQGNLFGQLGLGLMYHEGRGVPQNYAVAAIWLRKAADQGHPTAQFALGQLYRGGLGVKKDLVEAYKWASLGLARQGYPDAKQELEVTKSEMTPEQIEEAKRRANEFKPVSTTKMDNSVCLSKKMVTHNN